MFRQSRLISGHNNCAFINGSLISHCARACLHGVRAPQVNVVTHGEVTIFEGISVDKRPFRLATSRPLISHRLLVSFNEVARRPTITCFGII